LLYEHYNERRYWWQPVTLYRRTAFGLVQLIPSGEIRAFVYLFLCFLSIIASFVFTPFIDPVINSAEMLSFVSLLLMSGVSASTLNQTMPLVPEIARSVIFGGTALALVGVAVYSARDEIRSVPTHVF